MHTVCGQQFVAFDLKVAQDAERYQRDDTLAARWDFMHGEPGVIKGQAVCPEAFVAGKVIQAHHAVVPGAIRHNFSC